MTLTRRILILLLLLAARAASGESTAVINVNVIPMTVETVIREQTVIVSDGLITAIGPVAALPVPEGARVVDGTDRYLVPGLAEMHAHVPPADSDDLERYFRLFVANGVTTVRSMLGHDSHLGLREELRSGKVLGPHLVASGPSLNGRSVDSVADAQAMVRAQHAAGYDFLKIHPGLKAAEFEAVASTAKELGMPFAGHVTVAVGIERAMTSGMATIDHLDGYLAGMLPANVDRSGGYGGWFGVLLADQADEEMIAVLARKTAAAGTWNVPTNVLVEQLINEVPVAELTNRDDMRYMPRATVRRWAESKRQALAERGFTPAVAARAIELRRRLILALHDEGAGLLLGSDAPQVFNVPGFSLHFELENMVVAGLSPFEALRMGTANVLEFMPDINSGTIEVGRSADMILLDADPLEDIENTRRIHGVMLRGRWLPSSELEQLVRPYAYSNHD